MTAREALLGPEARKLQAAQQPMPPAHLLSAEESAMVVLAWVLLAAGLAFLRMRSMDIGD